MSSVEDALINELDDKRLAEMFLPAIKAVLAAGGGATAILKNSEVLAAIRLATVAMSGKPEQALKASIEILNRVQGRPVERTLSIYADVSEMNDDQLDREIRQLAKQAGVTEVVQEITQSKASTARSKKLPRRSKQSAHVS